MDILFNKINIFIVLTIICAILNIGIISYSEYSYSFTNLSNKRDAIEQKCSNVTTYDNDITDKQQRLASLNQKKDYYEGKSLKLERHFNTQKLDLHLPSILISLEQNANYYGVNLNVAYEKIKRPDNIDNKNDNPHTENDSDSEQNKEEENKNEKNKEEEKIDEENENNVKIQEETNFDTDKIMELLSVPSNEVFDVTSIPINIRGDFVKVRNYLNYLDTIDYIESNYIEIKSDGKNVKADVILYVFHSKEGDVQ